jgi:very-short-patch-repair endonuclease
MRNQATPIARANAQVLRREMTDSERKLWQRLRGEQLGVKFRRQHPLGNYIADFACLVPKLIVELDGSQHQAQQGYDARRDAFFGELGFDVLRFPSNDPFVNLEGVLQAIANRLVVLTPAAPIPAFPRRGKEQENPGASS